MDHGGRELALSEGPQGTFGRLAVTVSPDPDGASYLSHQFATYPYHLCRPQRFEGDPAGMATVYVQSCAGGIFENDRLTEAIVADAGAQVHVTTQASTIVHSMERGAAQQDVRIVAREGTLVEFLPDPFILFPQARLASHIRLEVHPSATAMIAESFLLHDPQACGAFFDKFASEVQVVGPGGELIVLDRSLIEGTRLEAIPNADPRFRAHGSFLLLCPAAGAAELLDRLRGALERADGTYAGASLLPKEAGVLVRLLAEDGLALRTAMTCAWSTARWHATGVMPRLRRK